MRGLEMVDVLPERPDAMTGDDTLFAPLAEGLSAIKDDTG